MASETSLKRTRTFCCCIPVRGGVVLLATIGIIGGSGLSALGCLNLIHKSEVMTQANQIANGVLIAVYTILAIVSLFGLIGAIVKKKGLINLYFAILIGHLLFSFALGIYMMYCIFGDSSAYINQCREVFEEPSDIQNCKDGETLMKAIVVGVSIIAWLLEIWACVIVFNYSKQLDDEEDMEEALMKDNEVW